jgi:hypothetical protein
LEQIGADLETARIDEWVLGAFCRTPAHVAEKRS